MTIRKITIASGTALTCTVLLLGLGTAAGPASAAEPPAGVSSAVATSRISAPSALAVYREPTTDGEIYRMSARPPLTGGSNITGMHFVLKDVKTGKEVDSTWAFNPVGEHLPMIAAEFSLDKSTVSALAKDDLVVLVTAYQSQDNGDTIFSATPARAMIYAKNRAQIQRVNHVRSNWNADGSLTLTWNTPNYSGDGRVILYNIWAADGSPIAQPQVTPDPYAPTTGINSLVLDAQTARRVGAKVGIIPGVLHDHRAGDPWWVTVPSQPTAG